MTLHGNGLSDAGLEHLEGLTHLKSLDLKRWQITDAGLEHLKGLTSLEGLDLAHTQVTDVGFTGVRHRRAQIGEATQHTFVGLRADSAPKGTAVQLVNFGLCVRTQRLQEARFAWALRCSRRTQETAIREVILTVPLASYELAPYICLLVFATSARQPLQQAAETNGSENSLPVFECGTAHLLAVEAASALPNLSSVFRR
jgi:hypothetical protein